MGNVECCVDEEAAEPGSYVAVTLDSFFGSSSDCKLNWRPDDEVLFAPKEGSFSDRSTCVVVGLPREVLSTETMLCYGPWMSAAAVIAHSQPLLDPHGQDRSPASPLCARRPPSELSPASPFHAKPGQVEAPMSPPCARAPPELFLASPIHAQPPTLLPIVRTDASQCIQKPQKLPRLSSPLASSMLTRNINITCSGQEDPGREVLGRSPGHPLGSTTLGLQNAAVVQLNREDLGSGCHAPVCQKTEEKLSGLSGVPPELRDLARRLEDVVQVLTAQPNLAPELASHLAQIDRLLMQEMSSIAASRGMNQQALAQALRDSMPLFTASTRKLNCNRDKCLQDSMLSASQILSPICEENELSRSVKCLQDSMLSASQILSPICEENEQSRRPTR